MRKILNWTFGSCFRTLGRFLAIFIVFALLLFVGSKLDLELPSWLGLRVNAAMEGSGWYDKNVKNVILSSRFVDWTSSTNYTLLDSSHIYIKDGMSASVLADREKLIVGQNGVSYQIYLDESLNVDYLYSIQLYVCTDTAYNSDFNNFRLNLKTGIDPNASLTNTPNFQFATISQASTLYTDDSDTYFRNFTWCGIYNSLISPSVNGSWYEIQVKSPNVNINFNPYLMGYTIEELGIYNNSLKTYIENAINTSGFATAQSVEQVQQSLNQVKQEVQELNNSIDETNNTIKDDDTTGAQDSAGGFFDSFQSEDFGLSSIVTAPLRGINAMLTDTCVAPSATYKGQTFSLPCGSMLWSRPGGEDFKSFINVMYGGFLAYLVIRKFFLDVENLKNPDSDKVEVDKL